MILNTNKNVMKNILTWGDLSTINKIINLL